MAKKASTTAQIVVDYSTGELMPQTQFSFTKARLMRRNPTISLCRSYSVAPILAANWAAEGDPEQAEFLEAQFQPIRNALLRTALLCEFDFGWKAYELVYGLADFTFKDGHTERLEMIQRVKPLKNDFTKARYDKATGDFIGVSTIDQYNGLKIFIDAEHTLFVNFDDEGLGNYGEPAMQVAEAAYDGWNDANDAASKYDKKVAGTFLVIEFPVGETPYGPNGGKMTDNFEIAKDAAKAMMGTGQILIPKDFKDIDPNLPPELNTWKFSFLEPQAKQASFVDRQKYLDAQMVRAAKLPERALIEGEFGTKAEASVHASAALLIRQQHHEDITELLNLGPVNLLLKTNWGSTSTAWLKAMPLSEDQNTFYTELLKDLLADAGVGPDIKSKIDYEALLASSNIPMIEQDGEPGEARQVGDSPQSPIPADGDSDQNPPPNSPQTVSIRVS